jgi:septal ring factor EnvC (AmiA/AmiB activator)
VSAGGRGTPARAGGGRRIAALAALALALVGPGPLAGQGTVARDLRESQLRLDSIRQERARLQNELESIRSRVRDASNDLVNIGRQRAASASALQELDFQATVLQTQIEQTQTELADARQRMRLRTATLNSRLRSIYKRGPLHTVRVLLSAENFGNLLNRYKYLHLVTLSDRRIIEQVKGLESELHGKESDLRDGLGEMERLRAEQGREVAELRRLEAQSRRALNSVRQAETATADRLEKAAADERRVSALIDRLERERLAEERSGTATVPAAITTRDLGSLNWPVEGRVVYRFGPERKPNGITLINNGIGIGAAAGTPVQAVESGRVSHAGPFEGYGSMVMVNHGGGYYTLYMYLKSVSVREGQAIVTGDVIGTVGGELTPDGAHIEFQVRAPIRGGVPEPVDPLAWLKRRSGS